MNYFTLGIEIAAAFLTAIYLLRLIALAFRPQGGIPGASHSGKRSLLNQRIGSRAVFGSC